MGRVHRRSAIRPTRSGGQFQQAVQATPSISGAYRAGLQALLKDDRARLDNREKATGSVALDDALKRSLPNEHRWDYGIGLSLEDGSEGVLWLEPHHAASGQTNLVIDKLGWLKQWLQRDAPELRRLRCLFVWQLTNVESNPNDRRRRTQLAEKHGLMRVQGTLDLARCAQLLALGP